MKTPTNNERPAVHPKGPAHPLPAGAFLDADTDRKQAYLDAAKAGIFVFKTRVETMHEDRIV